MMAGTNMQHVPYRGDAPALTAYSADRCKSDFGLISVRLSTSKPATACAGSDYC